MSKVFEAEDLAGVKVTEGREFPGLPAPAGPSRTYRAFVTEDCPRYQIDVCGVSFPMRTFTPSTRDAPGRETPLIVSLADNQLEALKVALADKLIGCKVRKKAANGQDIVVSASVPAANWCRLVPHSVSESEPIDWGEGSGASAPADLPVPEPTPEPTPEPGAGEDEDLEDTVLEEEGRVSCDVCGRDFANAAGVKRHKTRSACGGEK